MYAHFIEKYSIVSSNKSAIGKTGENGQFAHEIVLVLK